MYCAKLQYLPLGGRANGNGTHRGATGSFPKSFFVFTNSSVLHNKRYRCPKIEKNEMHLDKPLCNLL